MVSSKNWKVHLLMLFKPKLNLSIIVLSIGFIVLIYTRFVGLDWGLPYPMHPDERNMAVALQQLSCKDFTNIKQCFNPNFFAYGQAPLYFGYIIVNIWHLVSGSIGQGISYSEAALSLRLISALSSVLNVIVLIKIMNIIVHGSTLKPKGNKSLIFHFSFFILIFSPYSIQFSHFGTTESLLMLLYSLLILLCLNVLVKYLTSTLLVAMGIVIGLAIGIKVSSAIFLIVPFYIILFSILKEKATVIKKAYILFRNMLLFSLVMASVAIIASPHNLINIRDFMSSFVYESSAATGAVKVFYTRQFENSVPILFQFIKIFPYALGWPILFFSILGFIGLSWQDSRINLLRLSLIVYFIPSAFLLAKWIRFMAPIFPIMTLLAILEIFHVINNLKRDVFNAYPMFKNHLQTLLIFSYVAILAISIVPGIAYLAIYQVADIRFTASDWIYKNIPENSYILSETANVVDIPLAVPGKVEDIKNYSVISFDFYNLDTDPNLQTQLIDHLEKANYIFIPSRRLFANHTCESVLSIKYKVSRMEQERCRKIKNEYPILNQYYEDLFSGNLGFQKVAEFSSFPKLEMFGKTIFELQDETAEETWTVFDHPVIRIYKRINP